ncbi:hypothetical protein B0T18DRAFT_436818 [Schizothecium vesticola]|uniref:THIF-type NAD/FAD binding fold domain-containing protein n=1 Tax=Schizothecium vesticola TaxID=314040 RepID=A0AA40F141_9PEZI|nr:hypothetical protein B0T18DRAFT_436818 [Schizothecium vesticola]
MSSLLSQTSSNSKLQLAATAAVSAAVAAAALLSYQRLQQGERLSRLKQSIPDPTESGCAAEKAVSAHIPKLDKEDEYNILLAQRAQAGDFDDDLILEQLARNRVFLGPEGLEKLRNAFVIIVGVGGVGSHAAAALARSGVSKLRLVDFDQVTLSSLNRHAVATLADVGIPKVQCLQRRLMAITPWVRFDLRGEKFEGKVAPSLLESWEGEGGQKPDFVIDAIDNIESKVELLKYCHDHDIPVISSMGAGTKSDPTRIMVGDIGTSTDDGLSRTTRRRLKLLGVTAGIPVVYSTEKMGEGKAALLPVAEEEFQKGQVGDLGPLPDFRVRILPVLGTMPAVFGYTLANHIILKIAGYPLDYLAGKARNKMYDGMLAYLQSTEEKIARSTTPGLGDNTVIGLKVPVTPGDISYLLEEVYVGKSIVTGVPTKLVLIRWKRPAESSMLTIEAQNSSKLRLHDLVCMTKDEATRHLKEVLQEGKPLEDLYGRDVVEAVEAKQREIEKEERHRRLPSFR